MVRKGKRVWIAWDQFYADTHGVSVPADQGIGAVHRQRHHGIQRVQMENMMVQTEKMMSVGGSGRRHGP